MQNQNTNEISSVTLIDQRILQVQFSQDWSIDECAQLSEKLISLTSATVTEQILGADLQCTRLDCEDAQLNLTFEEYSQSCWFECATELDSRGLIFVQQRLLPAVVG